MPELPEVETLRRLLVSRLQGAVFVSAEAVSPVVLRNSDPVSFSAAICGRQMLDVRRRGKYLLFILGAANHCPTTEETECRVTGGSDDEIDFIVHLRMRGSLLVEDAQTPPAKYLCASIAMQDGRELRYYDMWRWGELWLLPHNDLSALKGLVGLGPDPFDAAFTPLYLTERLRSRRAAIKPLLLDQCIVAGLGNIYCDESLNRAGIHPARIAASLSADEITRLYDSARFVLSAALGQGGSYAALLAESGGNLSDFEGVYTPQVYDRPGKPCPQCEQPLQKISFHGRGTTFCPNCQPDAGPLKSG